MSCTSLAPCDHLTKGHASALSEDELGRVVGSVWSSAPDHRLGGGLGLPRARPGRDRGRGQRGAARRCARRRDRAGRRADAPRPRRGPAHRRLGEIPRGRGERTPVQCQPVRREHARRGRGRDGARLDPQTSSGWRAPAWRPEADAYHAELAQIREVATRDLPPELGHHAVPGVEQAQSGGVSEGFLDRSRPGRGPWGVGCDVGGRAFDINGVATDGVYVAGDVARAPRAVRVPVPRDGALGQCRPRRRGRGAQHGEPRARPIPASGAAQLLVRPVRRQHQGRSATSSSRSAATTARRPSM